MRSRSLAWLLAMTLLATGATVVAAGCGDSGNGSEKSAQEQQPGEQDEASEEAESSEAAASGVPASLGEIESGAEDTIDVARAGVRARVVNKARAVLQAAAGATAELRAAGVPAARIRELQERAQELAAVAPRADLTQVSLAANRISALMPELYARYDDPVPPDVLKLDYLDREAQLRSLAGDRESIPATVKKLSATWDELRPDVVEAGGERLAARFTRHVHAMSRLARGSDDEALQAEAAKGLEFVDDLETQFRRQ